MPSTQATQKRKMLPTPPMPKGLPQAELTENAYQVLTRRYIRKGEKGELIEKCRSCIGCWLHDSDAVFDPNTQR